MMLSDDFTLMVSGSPVAARNRLNSMMLNALDCPQLDRPIRSVSQPLPPPPRMSWK